MKLRRGMAQEDSYSHSPFRGGERSISVSGREEQILELAANGKTDKEIALDLGISRDTVASYWRRVLLKFGAASRTEVVGRYAEMLAISRINQAEQESQRLRDEIRQRTGSEARELAHRNLLTVISEASLGYISKKKSVRDVLDNLLEEILSLTQSEYGFIGEVIYEGEVPHLKTHALTNITWDLETEALYAIHQKNGLEFRNLQSLFGHVMTSGKTVISNSPQEDPRRGGLPTGHPEMLSFLGIPIYSGEEQVGMVGIANRPGGYDQELVEYLGPIIATCSNLIVAWRWEQAQKRMQRQVQESSSLVRRLLDRLPSAVLSENGERKLVYVNEAFCSLFEIPAAPQDIVGVDCSLAAQNAKALFADPGEFLRRVEELVHGGEDCLYEQIAMADGSTLERDYLILYEGGERSGCLWIYRRPSPT
jgi:DNA-binding CsgD family transcriptional regulator